MLRILSGEEDPLPATVRNMSEELDCEGGRPGIRHYRSAGRFLAHLWNEQEPCWFQ